MPTIYREGPYRFFLNSREETRMHVHVQAPDGTAKFWLEPIVALAVAYQLNAKELGQIEQLVKVHQHEFIAAWRHHFSV